MGRGEGLIHKRKGSYFSFRPPVLCAGAPARERKQAKPTRLQHGTASCPNNAAGGGSIAMHGIFYAGNPRGCLLTPPKCGRRSPPRCSLGLCCRTSAKTAAAAAQAGAGGRGRGEPPEDQRSTNSGRRMARGAGARCVFCHVCLSPGPLGGSFVTQSFLRLLLHVV